MLLIAPSRGGLVKGERFRNHRYVGDPINAVKVFNDKEVDEIAVLDIEATRARRAPDFDAVQEICGEAFMPLGYGGGISRIEHVKELLQRGAEKVILNAAALASPRLVEQAAKLAGSSSVVVSIDVKRTLFSGYRVYGDGASRDTGLDPVDFAKRMERAGAGELVVTSIDREGKGTGYDTELLRLVSGAVRIPVVANGGAANIDHFVAAVRDGGASAVAAGSMFVFVGKHRAVLIQYPSQQELAGFFRRVAD